MFKVNPNRLLCAEEAPERREALMTVLLDSIKQVSETDAGYQLRFSPEDEDLVLVTDWIQAERMCNPFLRFNLGIEANQGPIFCELGGPSGTKSFLSSALCLNRWI